MNKNEIEKLILEKTNKLIDETINSKTLKKKYEENINRVHVLPTSYVNFNSFIASLSIRYGDLIQNLIIDLLKENSDFKVHSLSGKKFKGYVSDEENSEVSQYIKDSKSDLNFKKYNLNFLDTNYKILNEKEKQKKPEVKDIDLLLEDKNMNFYLFEIKLFDNHDTGKFDNIHMKLFYTTLALRRYFEESGIKYEKIFPNLYYFDSKKKKENIFLKENKNLFRGKEFWDKFSNLNFDIIKEIISNIQNDEEILTKINNETKKILIK